MSPRGHGYVGVRLWMIGALMLSLVLAGCGTTNDGGSGSGSGDGGTSNPASGGTTLLISTGPITGFSSIIVNGITFDIAQAHIQLDDEGGDADDLRLGMVVTVTGSRQGTASTQGTSVVFQDNLEGPIERLDLALDTLVVLGQTIRVNGLTAIEVVGRQAVVPLATLHVGDFVEISGVVDASGAISASRIESRGVLASNTTVELKGVLSNLNAPAATFQIGTLAVDFRTATVEGALANGALVEVHGTQATPGGPLRATRIQVKQAIQLPENTQGEIEGLVTALLTPTRFRIGERVVQTTSQTLFENGAVGNIALNVKLEVEGRLDATGTLVAEKISFRFIGGGNLRIEADVDAVNVTARTITLLHHLLHVPVGTQFKDNLGLGRDFNLGALRPGDRVHVRGFIDAQGNVVTSRLERSAAQDVVILQGPVDSLANPL